MSLLEGIPAYTGVSTRAEALGLPPTDICCTQAPGCGTPLSSLHGYSSHVQKLWDVSVGASRVLTYDRADSVRHFHRLLPPGSITARSNYEGGALWRLYQIIIPSLTQQVILEAILPPDLTSPRHAQWFNFTLKNLPVGVPCTIFISGHAKSDSMFKRGMLPLIYTHPAGSFAPDTPTGPTTPKPTLQLPQALCEASAPVDRWARLDVANIRAAEACSVELPPPSEPLTFRPATASPTCLSIMAPDLLYRAAYFPANAPDVDNVPRRHVLAFTLLPAQPTLTLAMCWPAAYTALAAGLQRLVRQPQLYPFLKMEVLTRTLAGNAVHLLTIAEHSAHGGRRAHRPVIALTARVHPGETNASWLLRGALAELLGNSAAARFMRRHFTVRVVPCLNPDGVVNGSYRTNLAGVDLNRCWKQPHPVLHAPVHATKQLLSAAAQAVGVAAYVDFHGHSRKDGIFFYGCETPVPAWTTAPAHPHNAAGASTGWWGWTEQDLIALQRVLPSKLARDHPHLFSYENCSFRLAAGKSSTARSVVSQQLGVPLAYTCEASFAGAAGKHFHAVDYLAGGAQVVHGLATLLACKHRVEKAAPSEAGAPRIQALLRELHLTADTGDHSHFESAMSPARVSRAGSYARTSAEVSPAPPAAVVGEDRPWSPPTPSLAAAYALSSGASLLAAARQVEALHAGAAARANSAAASASASEHTGAQRGASTQRRSTKPGPSSMGRTTWMDQVMQQAEQQAPAHDIASRTVAGPSAVAVVQAALGTLASDAPGYESAGSDGEEGESPPEVLGTSVKTLLRTLNNPDALAAVKQLRGSKPTSGRTSRSSSRRASSARSSKGITKTTRPKSGTRRKSSSSTAERSEPTAAAAVAAPPNAWLGSAFSLQLARAPSPVQPRSPDLDVPPAAHAALPAARAAPSQTSATKTQAKRTQRPPRIRSAPVRNAARGSGAAAVVSARLARARREAAAPEPAQPSNLPTHAEVAVVPTLMAPPAALQLSQPGLPSLGPQLTASPMRASRRQSQRASSRNKLSGATRMLARSVQRPGSGR